MESCDLSKLVVLATQGDSKSAIELVEYALKEGSIDKDELMKSVIERFIALPGYRGRTLGE